MKRISLNLDLDDNQIIDKEIEKLIQARVRQLTREVCEQQINEEFERIVKQRVEQLKNPWSSLSNNFRSRVTDEIEEHLVETVEKEFNLRAMISTKLQLLMNSGINEMIAQAVDESVRKHLYEMFRGVIK